MVVERRLALLDGVGQRTPLNDVISLDLQVARHKLIILDEYLVAEAVLRR